MSHHEFNPPSCHRHRERMRHTLNSIHHMPLVLCFFLFLLAPGIRSIYWPLISNLSLSSLFDICFSLFYHSNQVSCFFFFSLSSLSILVVALNLWLWILGTVNMWDCVVCVVSVTLCEWTILNLSNLRGWQQINVHGWPNGQWVRCCAVCTKLCCFVC